MTTPAFCPLHLVEHRERRRREQQPRPAKPLLLAQAQPRRPVLLHVKRGRHLGGGGGGVAAVATAPAPARGVGVGGGVGGESETFAFVKVDVDVKPGGRRASARLTRSLDLEVSRRAAAAAALEQPGEAGRRERRGRVGVDARRGLALAWVVELAPQRAERAVRPLRQEERARDARDGAAAFAPEPGDGAQERRLAGRRGSLDWLPCYDHTG